MSKIIKPPWYHHHLQKYSSGKQRKDMQNGQGKSRSVGKRCVWCAYFTTTQHNPEMVAVWAERCLLHNGFWWNRRVCSTAGSPCSPFPPRFPLLTLSSKLYGSTPKKRSGGGGVGALPQHKRKRHPSCCFDVLYSSWHPLQKKKSAQRGEHEVVRVWCVCVSVSVCG